MTARGFGTFLNVYFVIVFAGIGGMQMYGVQAGPLTRGAGNAGGWFSTKAALSAVPHENIDPRSQPLSRVRSAEGGALYLWLKVVHVVAVVMFLGNITTGLFWHAHALIVFGDTSWGAWEHTRPESHVICLKRLADVDRDALEALLHIRTPEAGWRSHCRPDDSGNTADPGAMDPPHGHQAAFGVRCGHESNAPERFGRFPEGVRQ